MHFTRVRNKYMQSCTEMCLRILIVNRSFKCVICILIVTFKPALLVFAALIVNISKTETIEIELSIHSIVFHTRFFEYKR